MKCVKVRYESERVARSAALVDVRTAAALHGLDQKPLRPYKCQTCRGWHLTKQLFSPGVLKPIARAELRTAVCGFMQGTQHYYWDFTLECGHHAERPCKYKPGGKVGWGRIWHGSRRSDVLPNTQKRARCHICAKTPPPNTKES